MLPEYGLAANSASVPGSALRDDEHRDLFTPRQLVALTTFSDLVGEAREHVLADAVAAGLPDSDRPRAGRQTALPPMRMLSRRISAFAVDQHSQMLDAICTWASKADGNCHQTHLPGKRFR